MTAPTPRLTPEEARRIDSHCIERSAFPSNESNITRLWMTRRILDLLDERAALVARAEQAERDMATFGIIELMIRNPNVDSFVKEHEKRLAQAEADRDALAAALNGLLWPNCISACELSIIGKTYASSKEKTATLQRMIQQIRDAQDAARAALSRAGGGA